MTGADALRYSLYRGLRWYVTWWRKKKAQAVASGAYVRDRRSRFGLRRADEPPRPSDDPENAEFLLLH